MHVSGSIPKVKAPKAQRQNERPKLIRPEMETPKIVKSKPATFQHDLAYLEQLQQNTQHQINLLQLMLEEQQQIQLAIRESFRFNSENEMAAGQQSFRQDLGHAGERLVNQQSDACVHVSPVLSHVSSSRSTRTNIPSEKVFTHRKGYPNSSRSRSSSESCSPYKHSKHYQNCQRKSSRSSTKRDVSFRYHSNERHGDPRRLPKNLRYNGKTSWISFI